MKGGKNWEVIIFKGGSYWDAKGGKNWDVSVVKGGSHWEVENSAHLIMRITTIINGGKLFDIIPPLFILM